MGAGVIVVVVGFFILVVLVGILINTMGNGEDDKRTPEASKSTCGALGRGTSAVGGIPWLWHLYW